MIFVSSTSVLDTDYYLNPSNVPAGGVKEADILEKSGRGLHTGYGQSKWVSEGLMRDAGDRGLQGAILRPGYVTGESYKWTTVTDDFLVRILKGCIQLKSFPDLGEDNFINMMPVDGVSRIAVAAATTPSSGMQVLNAVSRTMTFNSYLSILPKLGYAVEKIEYDDWRIKLQDYVASSAGGKTEEHALLPLYHMAISDLPSDSRSPVLSTANTKRVVAAASPGSGPLGVDEEVLIGYIAYLVAIGFMQAPGGNILPEISLNQERLAALAKIEGRGKI